MPLLGRPVRLSVAPAGAGLLVPKAFFEGVALTGVKG